jgi:RNA polymerase sigma-70 factor (ECF subfamily)
MTDFTSLYEAFAADVFRFALYLSGDRADAEDITSETFMRAWTSHEPIRTETVKGYLFTIARNVFLKQLRTSGRRAPLDENLRDSRPSAFDHAQQRAEVASVLEAMQSLPDLDRAALVMRTFDELPYREIARVLEITETAAKVKVHRARASLMNLRRA